MIRSNIRQCWEEEAREMYQDLERMNLGTHDMTEEHFVREYCASKMSAYIADRQQLRLPYELKDEQENMD